MAIRLVCCIILIGSFFIPRKLCCQEPSKKAGIDIWTGVEYPFVNTFGVRIGTPLLKGGLVYGQSLSDGFYSILSIDGFITIFKHKQWKDVPFIYSRLGIMSIHHDHDHAKLQFINLNARLGIEYEINKIFSFSFDFGLGSTFNREIEVKDNSFPSGFSSFFNVHSTEVPRYYLGVGFSLFVSIY